MTPPNAGMPEPSRPRPDTASSPNPVRFPAAAPFPGVPAAGQRPGAPVPPALASGPDFNSLLKALARRWPLALGLGLFLSVGAALAAWFLLSPKFTGFALLRVSFITPVIVGDKGGNDGHADFDAYKRLQMANLRRRDVLNHCLKKDSVKRLKIVQEQPDPMTWLEENVLVTSKEGTEIVKVALATHDADEAVQLIQALVDSYNTLVMGKEQEARQERVVKLQTLTTEARTKLENLRKTLNQNRQKVVAGDREAQKQNLQLYLAEYSGAKQHLTQVEAELGQAEFRLATHQANEKVLTNPQVSDVELNRTLESDPQAMKLQERITRIQDILSTDGPKYRNPDHPTLVQLRTIKANLEKAVEDRRAKLAGNVKKLVEQKAREDYRVTLNQLKTAVEVLTKEKTQWKVNVAQLDKDIRNLGSIQNNEDQATEEIHQQERLVEDLIGKQNVLEIEAKAAPRVEVWQPAGLAKVDLKRRILAAGGGGVGTLFLVCFGVGWWEFRARRIQTAEEVSSGLGMRVVGAVPALPGPSLARLVAAVESEDVHENNMVESIDAIRTMLLRDASLQATRVIMVTSALAGEGKTTLAGNLATSLARAGRKTLLIDCDLRCPAAHQLFEQTLQPGFSEILLGEVDLIDAIRPTTAIDGLWLIPAGQWDREVIQALARPGLGDIFEKLKEEFDFIVVDSHPVLPATDSLLIGQNVDGVLFSLMKDISQVPRVQTAGQRLTELGIRVLGAVVNGMPADEFETEVPAAAASR